MRSAVISVLLAACSIAGLAAQGGQTPIFRSGVEILEVDVTVVDGQGRSVDSLRAPEFIVTVDGQPRRVVSAEYISETGLAPQAAATADPYVSSNTDRRAGRLIVLAIDQNNMTLERVRGSLEAARKFISGLSPNDRVALIAIPLPGPRVDFTTNHQQIRDALNGVFGHAEIQRGRFNISNYEAMAFDSRSDPLAIDRMLFRLCGDLRPTAMRDCSLEVELDATQLAQHIRMQTGASVSALRTLFMNLRDVEGPKSLVLMSQGLMLDGGQADAKMLADLAAEARVGINVVLFDWDAQNASERLVSDTQSDDRALREGGLEELAARSGGALFHVAGSPQIIFERIITEFAGRYMLGVEPTEQDRDGKSHEIQVKVRRQGVQVRARQQFQYAARDRNAESRDDMLGRLLSSPSPATEIPMRVTTYAYQEGAGPKVKLVVAAELDPATTGAVDISIGHAIYDDQGRQVNAGQERKVYSANIDRPLRYEWSIVVDPGTYRFKLAAIDQSGDSGSVEREAQAWQTSGQLVAVGDLMLSAPREVRDGSIRPPVLFRVNDGQVMTFTELYTNKAGSLDSAKVAFEVAETADSPTLKSDVVAYRIRPDGLSAQAVATVPVGALPPGRYVVRAMVSSSGRIVGKLVRPFVVLPGSVPAPAPTAAAPVNSTVVAAPAVDSGLIVGKPSGFNREDMLKPEMLRAVFDVMDKTHPSAKPALVKARTGQLAGTALMALEAGDQGAGALLRGLEYFSKGQLDPAATQFGVALRSAPDSALASFFLGACYAAAGKDKEALTNWERARAAQLPLPAIAVVIAEAWLRLDQPAQAVVPLADALAKDPQNDGLRKNLAIAQSRVGQHQQAYATITPYLAKNLSDPDALMVALQAIYRVRTDGKSIEAIDSDNAKAAGYARAYAAVKGPNQALVEKWLEFLEAGAGK